MKPKVRIINVNGSLILEVSCKCRRMGVRSNKIYVLSVSLPPDQQTDEIIEREVNRLKMAYAEHVKEKHG